MKRMSRWIKKFFGFDASTAISLKNVLAPKRLSNVLKYLLSRNLYPVHVLHHPITLMVEISTLCNFQCSGCERSLFQKEEKSGGLPKMNVSLENLKKLGKILPYVYSTYFVSGLGEPFLNPEFWDIHRFFKKYGVKTGYFTNASLIDEDKVKRTFAERVDSVLISMDSHIKNRYEAIKKGSSFEKVVAGIKMFADYKKRFKNHSLELGLNFIFRSDNYHDIYDYLDFAKSLGVDFINASAFIVHVKEEMDKSMFFIDEAKRAEIFRQAEKKAKKLGIRIRLPNIRPSAPCPCFYLWHGVSIFYNGDVCACPFFRTERDFYFHVEKGKVIHEKRFYKNTILGNYLEQDFFTEIWNGPRAKESRLALIRKKGDFNPCGACYYKHGLH